MCKKEEKAGKILTSWLPFEFSSEEHKFGQNKIMKIKAYKQVFFKAMMQCIVAKNDITVEITKELHFEHQIQENEVLLCFLLTQIMYYVRNSKGSQLVNKNFPPFSEHNFLKERSMTSLHKSRSTCD